MSHLIKSHLIPVGQEYVCGVPTLSQFIIGGEDALPSRYPWQVSLQWYEGQKYEHVCGAVLVHPEWVLSAAHCVVSERYNNMMKIAHFIPCHER